MLCGSEILPEGNHTLQLNTVIQSEPLYVDQVQYQTAATADIGSVWTDISQRDGRVNFSPGWEEDGLLKWTYTPGAWLTFDFVGTGVIWAGYTPDNPGAGRGLGQYLVDDQVAPTNFDIPLRGGPFFNQPYFHVSGLSPGPHRLQVTNAGNTNTAALGVTHIYLKNSPISKRDTGKVIGGAVGGSIGAVLLLLAIMIFIWRRRRLNQQQEERAWGLYANLPSNSPPIVPLTGALGPTTLVTPYGSYQPTAFGLPAGANQSTTFVTPSGPTTFVTPFSDPHRGLSYNAAPSVSHPHASTSFATQAVQPQVQQMVWPTPRRTPIQHIQDGRLEQVDYDPYQQSSVRPIAIV
ncbi:hypothetical protein EST38_g9101 [Candolleomyces aberdarensis]|uniref:Transmembrane protein n=1 Tax=Candolleomyces aberdarensis TaxID=2316362 RepID=A0A4Q2DAS7_9AGAR|nr:hypothetical protein EST38_g9101 [Candolleomyces aberdarensis]